MRRFQITAFSLILLLVFVSCRPREDKAERVSDSPELSEDVKASQVRVIFYNLCLPTEMSGIFEKSGTNYIPSLLNDPENFARYQDDYSMALNIGVFGVDLSYSHLFDQKTATAKYFNTVQVLSEKLGIPREYYEDILTNLDKYMNNQDSISRIATRIYEFTDDYLRRESREPHAALIITGGWIEALHIACGILEQNPDNIEMIHRIAEQKYSLNSLISLLNNYQDDYRIIEYILMLKQLRESYSRFEIYYNSEDLVLDTLTSQIKTTAFQTNLSPEIASEITRIVKEIREEIVN